MKTEFVRYGLSAYRMPVGSLQILGALGLIIGYFSIPELMLLAAGGLMALMVLGFVVRIKIKDSMLQSLPALFYALLNFYLATNIWSYLQIL